MHSFEEQSHSTTNTRAFEALAVPPAMERSGTITSPESDKELRSLVDRKMRAVSTAKTCQFSPASRLRSSLRALVLNAGIDPSSIQFKNVPASQRGDVAVLLHSHTDSERQSLLEALFEDISQGDGHSVLQGAHRVGPFVNLSLNSGKIIDFFREYFAQQPEQIGKNLAQDGQSVLVDYSSPNIGKALHVGHLGTTLVGQAISNILEGCSACVFRINHLGDWGTPLGMLKVAEELWGHEPEHKETYHSPAEYYSGLYQRFHQASKQDPELRERAKSEFRKLEEKDPAARAFWETVRSRSIQELEQTYRRLGISFDAYIGEAYYEDGLPEVSKLLHQHPESITDDGCQVIDFSDPRLGPALIKKSDGSTTYLARDVAAAIKRKEIFEPDKSLYVIGNEQAQHMRQLFAIVEHLGVHDKGEAVHVPIGLITQKGAKISSRAGGAFALEEYLDLVTEAARKKLQVSGVTPSHIENVAEQVALGAVYFHQLSSAPGKPCEFDLEKILDFQGRSGPYIQYTGVRLQSLLRKINFDWKNINSYNLTQLSTLPPDFQKLLTHCVHFPDAVQSAATQLSPHPLALYLFDLAQHANTAYQNTRLVSATKDEQAILGAVFSITLRSLRDGLRLINISIPEVM